MNVSDDDFNTIVDGLGEAAAIMRGTADPATYRVHYGPEGVDVRALRKRLGLTQAAFALRYGFSHASVRDWEQGRHRPETAIRSFLKVIDREPEAVDRALGGAAKTEDGAVA